MIPAEQETTLQQRVSLQLARLVPPPATCLVAVSGGPDSLALLDLLDRARGVHGSALLVAHVDHGIHPDSVRVAAMVEAEAQRRGLTFHCCNLSLGAAASETRARVARRAALTELAAVVSADAILLAHHADDQAETILLRLLRGSGPAGLAGMAPRQGIWVRPLLGVRRAELVQHLESHGQTGWADPANSDTRHLRSWLRSAIVPVVVARLPDAIERLGRSAGLAAESRRAWDEVLEGIPGLLLENSGRGISVAAPLLQGYRSALRHAVLAAIGRRIGVLLGERRLAAIDSLVERHSGGSIALDGRWRAELAFGRLTFYRDRDESSAPVMLAPGNRTTVGEAEFVVKVGRAGAATRNGWTTALVPGKYVVRTWRAGDRVRPLGGSGSRPATVLFREAKISPARRHRWPVVVSEDDATIVWVPGICRADVAIPAEGDEAWRVECAFT